MKKFDVKFLVIYILGMGTINAIVHFVLNAGYMSVDWWVLSILTGLIGGPLMYFWDLKRYKKRNSF